MGFAFFFSVLLVLTDLVLVSRRRWVIRAAYRETRTSGSFGVVFFSGFFQDEKQNLNERPLVCLFDWLF